ncbi:MAG: FapA family protein [Clostridia bacterium]|nr:FapA family protein [Clostridia bacterium]
MNSTPQSVHSVILENEYIQITQFPDGLYIKSFKKGFSFDQLNQVLKSHPEIEINDFKVLKSSIQAAPSTPQKFGKLKERILIESAENDLKAFVIFNCSKEDLDMSKRDLLVKETNVKLKEKGIIYGIKSALFFSDIEAGKPYLVAEGIPPVHGTDSIIKMYEIKEPKPEIRENGKVDFYELKLINTVKAGDWLGERISATDGLPGKSVRGVDLPPIKGKNPPLLYDKNSILEVTQGNKTTLCAKFNGAVSYVNGKITVSNHLDIDGDVDLSTGNIKFDGYVTIKGTVSDGFLVEATKDIEINGVLGLGNVKGIVSYEGSIYIKGGICSKGSVEIKAAKNFFTKFIDNAVVHCGGTVHIGFYCINSNIYAKEVLLESSNGQIKGGSIKAEIKVQAAIIGSEIEKRTIVEVTGFDREMLKEELESITQKISDLKSEQLVIKQKLSLLEDSGDLNAFQQKERQMLAKRLLSIRDEIKDSEERRKNLSGYLKARGNGEICITKKLFPNCMLVVKKDILEITSPSPPICFYSQDGELKRTS